ncbi:MAG: M48 family metalloprotease [Gammaproteobacteria bacterium]|nr:M48 family metalloprotease [Gammaproteobacteria bacterium]
MTELATATTIRCPSDLTMYESLLEDPLVKKVNEQIAKMEEDNPSNLRRRLLSTSVRLSERMAPGLHAMATDCIEKLDMHTPIELYAFASPQYNAMCFKPEDGRLFIMFASSLLEAFDDGELKFVLGHELGHHAYRHHDVPIGYILRGGSRPDPRLALSLFTWSRYAELSADRAGAHCARDLESVSRALFKLASGLSGKTIEFHLKDFLDQVDEMQVLDHEPGEGAPKEDWFATHPFSPLRVKALALFDESEFARDNGVPAAELESGVQSLMGLMEPSYLEGRTKSSEAMRRLLFAGALLVGNANGEMAAEEVEVFEKFFGSGAFNDDFDLQALEEGLDDRVEQVRTQASPAQRMQIMRDLCVVARAEGHTTREEREVLERVARGLGVSGEFVNQNFCSELDPD